VCAHIHFLIDGAGVLHEVIGTGIGRESLRPF
jgi:hypothetical protein